MHWSNAQLITTELLKIFDAQIQKHYPELSEEERLSVLEVTVSKQPNHGHYQCNSALKLAKKVQSQPRKIAEILSLQHSELIESSEIAGPGFINIWIKPSYLERSLEQVMFDPRLGIHKTAHPKKVIVEFSSPNTAKELHVGHLRSTIIGDSLARLFEFLGHHVMRLNHVGDWGTPFGMLIHFLKTFHPDVLKGQQATDLSNLAKWYKESRKHFDEDPSFKEASQKQVVELQKRELQALKDWEKICEISRQGYQKIYDLLGVVIEERGESSYHELLPQMIQLFKSKQLLTLSDGAECIFMDEFKSKEDEPLPLIIQKSDGGYNYATTDLAALYQRITQEHADRIIYVVDNGQSLHLQMIFKAAELAGYYDPKSVEVEHVPFGLVLGSDGKKFKTRSGDSEKLVDLLYKAIDKAESILKERESPVDSLYETAERLGINAVKYADLSSLRTKDYTFSYDKMLQFEGNTAAFLLYAYVRICSIQKKSKQDIYQLSNPRLNLKEPTEVALALHILQLREVLEAVAESLLPNRICDYLYQLAEKFNAFFRDCPVLGSEFELSRLILCELVKKAFLIGFSILGLRTVERM